MFFIDGIKSKRFYINQGVPQGSCLGPIFCTDYNSPIFYVMHAHGKTVYAYADDHQVYSAFSPDNVDVDIESMEECITEIRSWMQRLHLKMNDFKPNIIYCLEHRNSWLIAIRN